MTTHSVVVGVAQVWASPDAPRDIDAPALLNDPDMAAWMSILDYAARLDLLGRVETQVLHGERVHIVSEQDGWCEVRIPTQPTSRDPRGYPGWVRSEHIAEDPVKVETVLVSRRFAALRDVEGDRLCGAASMGSMFVVTDRNAKDVVVRTRGGDRLIRTDDIAIRSNAIEVALDFLGLPYLWSGLSGWGVDCSGLVHLSNHVVGNVVPRDSVDQFGAAVPDTVFFRHDAGVGRIHHVGFDLGNETMLHAPKTGRVVELGSLAMPPYDTEVSRPSAS